MKGKSSILTALLILTAGIVLIIINKSLSAAGIVICGGILFLVAAVLNIFTFLSEDTSKSKGKRPGALSRIFSGICSVSGLILGLCMLIFETVFTPLIPFIFGGLLVLGGLFHFYVLAISYRPIVFPSWTYTIPALLTATGVGILFINGDTHSSLMMILTGTGLCVFSAGVFIESFFINSYNKSLRTDTHTYNRTYDTEAREAETSHHHTQTLPTADDNDR